MAWAQFSPSARKVAGLIGCLALGAALSVHARQDAFWDTKNYHLYNAWALLNDRYARDITAAGMQSYFNPLADLPYFILATGPLSHWPRVLAALQGMWFGALLFVLFGIATTLARLQQRRFSMADVFAVLVGASGTMAVSQIGSTTQEIPLAVLVLTGLYLLLPLCSPAPAPRQGYRALIAGACCGLAVGLKPTAVVYAPAMVIAWLLASGLSKTGWKVAITYAVGTAIAFLLSYGWWGWHLYQLTGNPAFPMFNQIFHSDLTQAVGGTDGQFRPRNISQWLFYPFYWLTKNKGIVSEPAFADPRYATAMLAALVLALIRLIRRRRMKDTPDEPGMPALRLITVFVAIAYLLWMALFSILRYAVPIEAMTGLLALCAVYAVAPHWWQAPAMPWRSGVAMGVLFGSIAVCTYYPAWGRTAFGKQVFSIDSGPVESGSLVLITGSPAAYLAPFLPNAANSDFIGLTWFTRSSQGFGLWNSIQQKIAGHKGPLYAIRRDGAEFDGEIAVLHDLLPGYALTGCKAVRSNLEIGKSGNDHSMGLRLCRLAAGPAGDQSLSP